MDYATKTDGEGFRIITDVTEQPVTHIIMSYDEYQWLQNECCRIKNELNSTTEKLCVTETEKTNAELMNRNLLRICRERANAMRGITPKKTNDGFVVLSCIPYKQKYVEEVPTSGYEKMSRDWLVRNNKLLHIRKTADVWKMKIQTPFDASLPLESISDKIITDIRSNLLEECGVFHVTSQGMNGQYTAFFSEDGDQEAGVYKWRFYPDYVFGLWIVDLWVTTMPNVPMSRWPVRKRKRL